MRTRIAACSPKDAVAVPSLAATAACLATWAGGLLFGGDGIAGLRFRHTRGCLPRPRDRLGRHDSFGFDQGLCLVPSCPVNVPKVSRGRRTAASGCHLQPILSRPSISVSIRPCRLKCGDMAHPCRRVHLPMRSAILGIAGRVAPRRRQPQATAAAPVPDFHRPSVVQSVGRLLPTTWPQGHK